MTAPAAKEEAKVITETPAPVVAEVIEPDDRSEPCGFGTKETRHKFTVWGTANGWRKDRHNRLYEAQDAQGNRLRLSMNPRTLRLQKKAGGVWHDVAVKLYTQLTIVDGKIQGLGVAIPKAIDRKAGEMKKPEKPA